MANIYRQLVALLPGNPLLVGTVVAAVGDELTIETDDSRLLSARGAWTVGARVYFRPGGVVEGAAPALVVVDIPI